MARDVTTSMDACSTEECELEECAICFSSIAEDERLLLPCHCRVQYCAQCWDRALAQAFNDSGHPRCPTCRSPVRVDFDPQACSGRGRLVFSSESELDISRSEVVNRLAGQAAPLMTRLLRQYGAEHPTLRATARDPATALATRSIRELKTLLQALGGDPAGCVEKADIIERCRAASGGARKLAARCVAVDVRVEECAAPSDGLRCVCGGRLDRLSGKGEASQIIPARVRSCSQCAQAARPTGWCAPHPRAWLAVRARQLFAGRLPVGIGDEAIDHLISQLDASCVVCDLCDRPQPPSAPVCAPISHARDSKPLPRPRDCAAAAAASHTAAVGRGGVGARPLSQTPAATASEPSCTPRRMTCARRASCATASTASATTGRMGCRWSGVSTSSRVLRCAPDGARAFTQRTRGSLSSTRLLWRATRLPDETTNQRRMIRVWCCMGAARGKDERIGDDHARSCFGNLLRDRDSRDRTRLRVCALRPPGAGAQRVRVCCGQVHGTGRRGPWPRGGTCELWCIPARTCRLCAVIDVMC
eukprot:6516724-Prymnesium_polylepis.1